MKNQGKPFFIFLFLCFIITTTQAQLKLGPGISFGTEIENIGFTAKGHYAFTEVWEGSASFTYFLTGDDGPGIDIDLWTFNLDAHYIVTSNDKFIFYPLAGLNFANVSFDINTGFPGFDTGGSNTEVGLNLGAGIVLGLTETISVVGEGKYVLSDFDQLVLTAGVLFTLGAN